MGRESIGGNSSEGAMLEQSTGHEKRQASEKSVVDQIEFFTANMAPVMLSVAKHLLDFTEVVVPTRFFAALGKDIPIFKLVQNPRRGKPGNGGNRRGSPISGGFTAIQM